jgi:hypothetical protein
MVSVEPKIAKPNPPLTPSGDAWRNWFRRLLYAYATVGVVLKSQALRVAERVGCALLDWARQKGLWKLKENFVV